MIKLSARVVDNGLSQKLLKKEQAARKAMSYTMKDLKKRAPAKVAQQVAKVYAIKQGEVKPGKGGMAGKGHVHAAGETVAEFALVYTGQLMTPLHFKMTPSSPPGGGRRYTIRATIKKGNKVVIGHWSKRGSEGGVYARPTTSPFFLGTLNGGMVLPVQRKGDRLGKSFHTLSIPQMVANEEVAEASIEEINKLAQERLENNLRRFLNA